MMKSLAIFLTGLFFVAQAQASVKLSNGTLTVSVSGGDADTYGGSGSSAGDININLSYADAAKTIVSVTGAAVHYGKSETINEQIALKDLKQILLYANGGDGGRGSDGYSGSPGSNGSDGSPGSDGSDGCPPSNGSRGSDGSNGGDGGRGGDGGNGGHGGNGGKINVNSSPDQNELMLFVKTATGGGSGGRGGSGGSGGAGGRGGSGGRGGRGGRNTCKDAKGNPTNGLDGSDGWSGNDGRRGSDGYSGSDGSSGGDGRSGWRSFNLVSPSGTQSYGSVFDLDVTGSKFIDDTGDSILEPGEKAYLNILQVTNKGPMPSPAGQTIQFSFFPSSTLNVPAALSVPLAPIAPGASQAVTLKKGSLTLLVPDKNELIGKKAVANVRVAINNVTFDSTLDSGMAIHWPVSLTAAVAKSSHAFEVAKPLNFTLKNVGSLDLGPKGSQPLHVMLTWTSKTVPAADINITLADGRVFNLAQPALIEDLTVPANGTAPLVLNFLARDSKMISSGSGTLRVSLRLRDFNSPDDNEVQSVDTAINLALDLKSIEWTQSVNLAGARVQCLFPALTNPAQPIASFQITKTKGSDRVAVQVAVPGSASSSVSPVILVSSSKMLPHYEALTSGVTPQNAVDFLNKFVSPSAPKGVWSFKSCSSLP